MGKNKKISLLKLPLNKYKPFYNTFVRPEKRYIVILFILITIDTICGVTTPLIARFFLDDIVNKNTQPMFYINYIILLFFIAVAYFLTRYFITYFSGKLTVRVENNTRTGILDTLQNSTFNDVYKVKSGDILSRLMNDIFICQQLFTNQITQLFSGIIRIAFPLVVMLFLRWDLAIICISPIFIYMPISLFFGKRLKAKQKKVLEQTAKIYSFIKEALLVFPVIKAFRAEKYQNNRFNLERTEYYNSVVSQNRILALYLAVTMFLYFFPFILLFYIGGIMVLNGTITIGIFTAFNLYVIQFFNPINTVASIWGSIKMSTAAFDRVTEIMQMENEKSGKDTLVIKVEKIEFNNVGFSYGNKPVFDNLSLTFKNGINFLVGDNGTGKSTIFNLLLKFYSPNKGSILIDDQDINKVTLESLRQNISLVPQDAQLLDVSIFDNILLGNFLAKDEDVIAAAKLTKAHEFVSKLPNGYKTLIAELGLNISGGERQKIALARAFLKNAPIILIDEAVSIDKESKKSLYETLREVSSTKIIIIISHDYLEIKPGDYVIDLNRLKTGKALSSF